MSSFIELTTVENGKFVGNVNLLQRVFITNKGKVGIVGWNNNGYFEVTESYEQVLELLEKTQATIHRKK